MTSDIYKVKEEINAAVLEANQSKRMDSLLLNVKAKHRAYQETKLSEVEKVKAKELASVLVAFENIHLENVQSKLEIANKSLGILDELSNIQLNESKKIMKYAESLYSSSRTSSQIVFALIIIILLVLQALVVASKTSVVSAVQKRTHLN